MIAIVLAAGLSKRMRGTTPKVLLPLMKRPLLSYVLGAVRPLSPDKILVVVGNSGETVQHQFGAPDITFVVQPAPQGTAHAVMVCREFLVRPEEEVMVLCGDVPLLTSTTLSRLVQIHRAEQAGLTLITAFLDNPQGYGRIVRNGTGGVSGIVEERDASAQVRAVKEINAGIYIFQTQSLLAALENISPSPVTQEYYLTDTIPRIATQGRIVALTVENPEEILGVNTPEELLRVEAILKKRKEAGDFF